MIPAVSRLLLLFLFIPGMGGWAYSQTVISGTVTDTKGELLPGANVFIADSYDGATADEEGKFEFTSYESGAQVLKARYLGMDEFSQPVELNGEAITVEIKMKEGFTEQNTVVITAGGFGASDRNKAVVLNPLDIVTTAGALGDVYGALQFLPGTQRVGEEAGLFVRGGDASETATIIDGMIVQKPFFSTVPDIASRARFNPFLFKGTFFSTGGYSARYGQALSSALLLSTTDMPDTSGGGFNLTLVGGGGFVTKKWKKTSLSVSGNYSDITALFALNPQRQEYEVAPRSGGGSVIFRQQTSPTGILKFYGSYNTNFFVIRTPNAGVSEFYDLRTWLKSGNLYLNASYRESIGEKWLLQAAASFSDDRDKLNLQGVDPSPIGGGFQDIDVDNLQQRTQVKATLSRPILKNSTIWFGAEAHDITNNSSFSAFGFTGKTEIPDIYSAAYVEPEFYISPKIAVRVGGRAEYSTFLQEYNVAPRTSMAIKTGKYGTTSLAYGQFFQTQYAGYLQDPTLRATFLDAPIDYERADHYLANFQYIRDKRTFRAEVFLKQYKSLIRQVNPTFVGADTVTTFDNSGSGYARGIDIFWRDQKTIKNADYWVSYSYLDTKRLFRNYPAEVTPPFATDHTFSVVYKQFFAKIRSQIGASYAFATGRPYYNPNANVEFLSERTSNYHTLNLNLSYLTTIQNNFTVIFASVSNVLGRNNVFSYRFTQDGSQSMPVYPTSRRFFFIGAFISFQ